MGRFFSVTWSQKKNYTPDFCCVLCVSPSLARVQTVISLRALMIIGKLHNGVREGRPLSDIAVIRALLLNRWNRRMRFCAFDTNAKSVFVSAAVLPKCTFVKKKRRLRIIQIAGVVRLTNRINRKSRHGYVMWYNGGTSCC